MPHREIQRVGNIIPIKGPGRKVAPKSEVVLYIMCPEQMGLFQNGCSPLVL